MEIIYKEYHKYARPIFFNFLRIIMYLITIFILFGVYSRKDESEFILINLFVFIGLAIIILGYDGWIGYKKLKSYKDHKVEFTEDYLVFVDHRGVYKIPYDSINSYQLVGDQITIRINGTRFVISGRLHGISMEEIKLMVDFLNNKNVVSKSNLSFIYFVILFLVINYGSDYLFITVFNLSTDASLFGTLYICLVLGVGYYVLEYISARKFLAKEE